MITTYDLTDRVDQLRHWFETTMNRKISRARVFYTDGHTESQMKFRAEMRKRRAHQRRVLRFKRKLRALIGD